MIAQSHSRHRYCWLLLLLVTMSLTGTTPLFHHGWIETEHTSSKGVEGVDSIAVSVFVVILVDTSRQGVHFALGDIICPKRRSFEALYIGCMIL